MPLEPARLVRIGDRGRAAAHLWIDQVDAGEDPATKIGMRAIDARVEQGDRDAAPVVAGQEHREQAAGADRHSFLPEQSRRERGWIGDAHRVDARDIGLALEQGHGAGVERSGKSV